ncbi:MAG: hypothetical protein HDR88_02645 [Bacteroides sp.]|nr:hypothetical protein [Bacteroides sp.]
MKQTKIFAMLFSLACSAGFFSCSDDDVKTPLDEPVVTETAGSYNSLSFSWDKVIYAVQYGYRLSDNNAVVAEAGVTQATSVSFTGLTPATTYTLEVWAFAAMDGDYSTPPAVTLTATTDALVKLATPQHLTVTTEDGYMAFWDAVTDALDYAYTITDSEGAVVQENVTRETSVGLTGLPEGNYTFTVYADAHDGFSSGDSASVQFKVESLIVYSVRGTYYSAQLGAAWEATMEYYSNGVYSILAFYGVDGYNLDFKIDESNESDQFSFVNGEYVWDADAGYETWQIPTGLSNPSMLITYPWYNYCYMTGNQTSGEVAIGGYYGENYANWDYDIFTWPSDNTGDMTVDDLVGTYNNHFVGSSSLTTSDWTWEEFDGIWDATITKVSNNSVEIDGLFFTDCPVIGTVDFSEMSITFQPQEYDIWYTFAAGDDPEAPVVGYINGDGSISVPDFCAWYQFDDGTWNYYLLGTSELTKQSANGLPGRKGRPEAKVKKPVPVKKSAPMKSDVAKKPVKTGGKSH